MAQTMDTLNGSGRPVTELKGRGRSASDVVSASMFGDEGGVVGVEDMFSALTPPRVEYGRRRRTLSLQCRAESYGLADVAPASPTCCGRARTLDRKAVDPGSADAHPLGTPVPRPDWRRQFQVEPLSEQLLRKLQLRLDAEERGSHRSGLRALGWVGGGGSGSGRDGGRSGGDRPAAGAGGGGGGGGLARSARFRHSSVDLCAESASPSDEGRHEQKDELREANGLFTGQSGGSGGIGSDRGGGSLERGREWDGGRSELPGMWDAGDRFVRALAQGPHHLDLLFHETASSRDSSVDFEPVSSWAPASGVIEAPSGTSSTWPSPVTPPRKNKTSWWGSASVSFSSMRSAMRRIQELSMQEIGRQIGLPTDRDCYSNPQSPGAVHAHDDAPRPPPDMGGAGPGPGGGVMPRTLSFEGFELQDMNVYDRKEGGAEDVDGLCRGSYNEGDVGGWTSLGSEDLADTAGTPSASMVPTHPTTTRVLTPEGRAPCHRGGLWQLPHGDRLGMATRGGVVGVDGIPEPLARWESAAAAAAVPGGGLPTLPDHRVATGQGGPSRAPPSFSSAASQVAVTSASAAVEGRGVAATPARTEPTAAAPVAPPATTEQQLAAIDQYLFESVFNMHPFAAAAFLRAFIACSFGLMLFHVHSLVTWPESCFVPLRGTALTEGNRMDVVSWLWLLAQVFLLVAQTPLRMKIQRALFRVSTAQDTADATRYLRTIFRSWSWHRCRDLGRMSCTLCFLGPLLLQSPGLLLGGTEDGGVQSLSELQLQLLSVNSSNCLILVMRSALVLSLLYFVQVAQPTYGGERKRRGLSEGTIQRLRRITFQSSRTEETTLTQCAVCLEHYEDNDELMVLPCDPRHNFHAQCIEPWLQRMNTCPLCQRGVPDEA